MSQMWFKLALKAGQTSPWILVGEDAMSDEERELTGGEIQRFVELQAAEGKTAGGGERSKPCSGLLEAECPSSRMSSEANVRWRAFREEG